MKRALLLSLLVAGCAAAPPAPAPAPVAPVAPVAASRPSPKLAPAGAVALRNPGFEADAQGPSNCARSWSCTMHADPKSFRFFADEEKAAGGKRSYCVEPVKKEPWAMITQAILDKSLNGSRVRLTMAVRLQGVDGVGAGPWAQVVRAGVSARPTFQKLDKGTRDWQDVSVEFEVPDDAVTVEVGATLRGTGRACFDDARLEVLRVGKNPV